MSSTRSRLQKSEPSERENSSRGNDELDNGGEPQGEAPDTFSDSDSWGPRDAVKGDVARMTFSMDVRYDGSDGIMPYLRIVNDTRSETGHPVIGVLCTLYRWHWDDPMDNCPAVKPVQRIPDMSFGA